MNPHTTVVVEFKKMPVEKLSKRYATDKLNTKPTNPEINKFLFNDKMELYFKCNLYR